MVVQTRASFYKRQSESATPNTQAVTRTTGNRSTIGVNLESVTSHRRVTRQPRPSGTPNIVSIEKISTGTQRQSAAQSKSKQPATRKKEKKTKVADQDKDSQVESTPTKPSKQGTKQLVETVTTSKTGSDGMEKKSEGEKSREASIVQTHLEEEWEDDQLKPPAAKKGRKEKEDKENLPEAEKMEVDEAEVQPQLNHISPKSSERSTKKKVARSTSNVTNGKSTAKKRRSEAVAVAPTPKPSKTAQASKNDQSKRPAAKRSVGTKTPRRAEQSASTASATTSNAEVKYPRRVLTKEEVLRCRGPDLPNKYAEDPTNAKRRLPYFSHIGDTTSPEPPEANGVANENSADAEKMEVDVAEEQPQVKRISLKLSELPTKKAARSTNNVNNRKSTPPKQPADSGVTEDDQLMHPASPEPPAASGVAEENSADTRKMEVDMAEEPQIKRISPKSSERPTKKAARSTSSVTNGKSTSPELPAASGVAEDPTIATRRSPLLSNIGDSTSSEPPAASYFQDSSSTESDSSEDEMSSIGEGHDGTELVATLPGTSTTNVPEKVSDDNTAHTDFKPMEMPQEDLPDQETKMHDSHVPIAAANDEWAAASKIIAVSKMLPNDGMDSFWDENTNL